MPGSVRGTSSRPAQDVVVRIVARKRSDGRVEFGLRKVLSDGTLSGNLLPRARMFPTTAAVGSWLQSTPISVITTQPTATTPTTRYSSVDAGIAHACGLSTAGAIACWGDESHGQGSAPAGTFTAVAAGFYHSCGLRADGSAVCWGSNPAWDFGQADAPSGEVTAIAAAGSFSCGLRPNGTIACWGRLPVIGPPSGVQFTNN